MRVKGGSGSVSGKHRGTEKLVRPVAKAAPAWMADLPVQIGQQYEAEIIGISHDGEGVGRVNGFTLFVAGALPGERALVRVGAFEEAVWLCCACGSAGSESGSG